ncbi:DUF4190 domain-containing protein [Frigoribacterium sp. PvP032]|uniref:DUF4190 domain-containing protein n=1 Tax=Frigoribacterium sp. PvP032 TaxID=2806589 RepID=UPI001AE5D734|nr:DUF4190 domain-containing protein [Frigoribacterium sp. PvP032]MBP1191885.1 hypothetical protein [Frigoribacterium sp. PvP032]
MTDQNPAPQGQPYQQDAYQQNPYQAPPAPNGGYGAPAQRNSLALVALILGIAGFFTGIASIGAIVVGHISLSQIKKTGEEGRSMALWGLILGYVAVALFIIATIFIIIFVAAAASTGISEYNTY